MSELRNLRRYCVVQAYEARQVYDFGLHKALLGVRDTQAGTQLVSSTPGYSKLVAAGYVALEDLDGADADELQKVAGITRHEATAIFAALGLTPPT